MDLKSAFFACIIAVFSFTYSVAQREKNDGIPIPVSMKKDSKTPSDTTLKPASFSTGTPVLYKYVEGGYKFGTNKLGDHAYAQVFKVASSYIINGFAIQVGAKQQLGEPDTLNIMLYKPDGPGTALSGPANNAPDSVEKIIKIPVNQLDTTNLTFINLIDSFIVYTDYAVGVDFSLITDDTIGLVTTTDGDADSTELSWNKWSEGTWHTILEPTNWGMDLDLGIFIIADVSSANVNDNYFVNGIKLSQNRPNPALNGTIVQYELQNNSNVTLEIYDVKGILVLSCDEGMKTSGLHSILIDSEKLGSEIYYYSLKAGMNRLTKKMLVLK